MPTKTVARLLTSKSKPPMCLTMDTREPGIILQFLYEIVEGRVCVRDVSAIHVSQTGNLQSSLLLSSFQKSMVEDAIEGSLKAASGIFPHVA